MPHVALVGANSRAAKGVLLIPCAVLQGVDSLIEIPFASEALGDYEIDAYVGTSSRCLVPCKLTWSYNLEMDSFDSHDLYGCV
jgi:hypothetical protein